MVITKTLEVRNNLGIHARAAAKIVSLAGRFKARVTLERDGIAVNGKSILGILTMACPRGSFLSVTTEGNDAAEAMQAIESLFTAKFDEE